MPLHDAPPFLIHTKLNPPRPAPELLERKRLYAALDLHRPLTLVVAPAGCGKTTLASSWASRSGLRSAWLSLDAGDNSISVFLDYFLAAVERLFPSVVQDLTIGPEQGIANSYVAVARKLADELDSVDENFAIILDDYHFLDNPTIHAFVTELTRFPPRGLSLVIVSRVEPPLPLASMRARAYLAEIRSQDLRFTVDEIADYLQHELAQAVDSKTLSIIDEATEGWITGLRLAALYLREQKDTALAAAQFKSTNRLTVDYLALEVLAKQGSAIQDFLLRTSILQRMCPALCAAILGTQHSVQAARSALDFLEGQNLFVTILDDDQQWYRYHPLFQRLLESRLQATCSAGEIASLYTAASHWCAEQNLVDEAVSYALSAGNISAAVALIEQHRQAAMNAEQWPQLERWLGLVRRREIDAHPELILLEAWILHKRQRLNAIAGRLDLAVALLQETALADGSRGYLYGEVDVLRSQLYFRQGDGENGFQMALRSLERTPLSHSAVRGVALLFATAGRLLCDGLQPALDLLNSEISAHQPFADSEWARILLVRCYLYWIGADMAQLELAASELLRFARRHHLQESVAWAHYFCGCARYQQNDLAGAGDSFLAVINLQHVSPGLAVVDGSFGLAMTLHVQGNDAGATAALAAALEYARQIESDAARETALAFQAYLHMLQGKSDGSAPWLASTAHKTRLAPIVTFFAPPIAAAALLVHHGTRAALAEADHLLRRLSGYLSVTHNDRFRIDALVLHSRCLAASDRHSEALATLEAAVTLAEPGGVMRAFIDAGPQLASLLAGLKLEGKRDAFVQRLCQEFEGNAAPTPAVHRIDSPLYQAARIVQPRHPDLIELLTNRELEVLQLLALRLTNSEIADKLGISPGTVKQHTINIFRKLHAENRRQAIVQARAMGFKLETPYPF